jgi:hypothetical protein
MKPSEKIGRLMFRYMRNELNPGETRELLAWRNRSSKHESAFQEATDWENLRANFRALDKNSEATWEKIKERYPYPWRKKEEVKKKTRRMHPLLRIAAVLVLVLVLSEMYTNYQKNRIHPGTYGVAVVVPDGSSGNLFSDMYHDMVRGFQSGYAQVKVIEHENGELEYVAQDHPNARPDQMFGLLTYRGNAFLLNLPGIARIWINSSSKIWFPANLSRDTIRIKLTGEACFDIPASQHHVIIEIPSAVNGQPSTLITETGYFNVHAYPADSLQVGRDRQSVSWKNGMIFYQDASLKTILDEIARWYNVTVEYKSNASGRKYHINLPRTASFSEVVRALTAQGAPLLVNRNIIVVL